MPTQSFTKVTAVPMAASITPFCINNPLFTLEDFVMSAIRLVSFVVLIIMMSLIGRVEAAEPATRMVHVLGTGTVRVVPDQVVIGMTITAVDDDLVKVRTDSDAQARSVLSLAKKHGVSEDRFEVSRLELSLGYNEQLRRRIYQVERDVSVTLHELSKLDGLLSDLLGVPNSKISGITFGSSKARQHRLDALRRAVADAQEKARLLASLNELALGKARDISIEEESQSPFVISLIPSVGAANKRTQRSAGRQIEEVPRERRKSGRKETLPTKFVALQAANKQPAQKDGVEGKKTPFALGLLEVTVSVSIDFELIEK